MRGGGIVGDGGESWEGVKGGGGEGAVVAASSGMGVPKCCIVGASGIVRKDSVHSMPCITKRCTRLLLRLCGSGLLIRVRHSHAISPARCRIGTGMDTVGLRITAGDRGDERGRNEESHG